MRRKKWMRMLGILAGISLLAGCAQTPESSVVKQKGKTAEKDYQEAQDSAAGGAAQDGANAGTAGSGGAAQDGTDAGTAGSGAGALRAQLAAPERYQSEVTDETGRLKILTDASVELPDSDRLPVIAVSQHPFEQEEIDRITETFFGEAKIYDGLLYSVMTKDEWRAQLEELKGYAAAGNLDPYGYGTDAEGNLVYDIYDNMEGIEQNIEAAPEERTLREVRPQFGLEHDDGQGGTYTDDDYFFGIVEMPDGAYYRYTLKRATPSIPMEADIRRQAAMDDTTITWAPYEVIRGYTADVPTEEELRQEIGISVEDARQLADEKVQMLGLTDMEAGTWELQLSWEAGDLMSADSGYTRERQRGAGYQFHYTRKLDGVPVTYTESYGGALESMDSETETWCYERLNITVSKNGIEEVELMNLYDIGDVQTENPELLPFSEIIGIYEKMMLIQNADIINYENYRTYRIDRIELGYGRIYEPAADTYSGILVPVWNFFGTFESAQEAEGQVYEYTSALANQSHLTINAVDGSVINLELGY